MVKLKGFKPSEDTCFYHLCRKKVSLKECNYCHESFCEEHANPKPAGLPNFTGTKAVDELYMEEWHKPGGHPCFPFTKIWTEKVKREKEEETQKFLAALDSMKKKGRESPRYITAIPMRSSKKVIQKKWIDEAGEKVDAPRNKNSEKEGDIGEWILLILVVALVIGGIFYFKHWQAESARIANLPKCSDGTLYNECSTNKPYYCYEGDLVRKAATCGCPEGYPVNFQDCKGLLTCNEGTPYNHCSEKDKMYCLNGSLISFQQCNNDSKISNFISSTWTSIKKIFATAETKTIEGASSVAHDWGITHDIYNIEIQIHNLVNEQRTQAGLHDLTFDSKLSDIARAHSLDMVQNNFFAHDNLKGQDPTARAKVADYSCYKDYGSYYTNGIAENIAMTPTGDVIGCGGVSSDEDIAKCTVDGWMNSPGHRQNILTPTYDREGIGVASSGNEFYITQDFC